MDLSRRRWVILPVSEIDTIDFSKVLQTNSSTLRRSVDGTKCFVKYMLPKPAFLGDKQEYTHSEILAILRTDEWTSPDPRDSK